MGGFSSTFLTPNEEFDKGVENFSNIFPFNNRIVVTYGKMYQLNAKDIDELY